MELRGTQLVGASRSAVWSALNDPDVLAKCVNGCEALVRTGDHSLAGTATIKVGPVRASFKGDLELRDIVPETTYTIIGQGKGGAAGFARGKVRVTLFDSVDGGQPATQLEYDLEAQVGGRLAQIGARLIQSACQSYIEAFFSNLAEHFRGMTNPGSEPDAVNAPVESVRKNPRVTQWLWIALLGSISIGIVAFALMSR